MTAYRRWSAAMAEALYGADGFYRRPDGPAAHFRTSVHASPLFAAAIRVLAEAVDASLGHPDPFDVVDVGAGDGELLAGLPGSMPVPPRWRLTAVEVRPRPAGLATGIGWLSEVPAGITGLVVANEWLDNVPLDVVEQTADGPRVVLVGPAGTETLGEPPDQRDLDWLRRYWPLPEPGDRGELGRSRDDAWAGTVGRLHRGVAVAIDYMHLPDNRPLGGTLTGFRAGVQVPPVPDGSCDLTAHVALDSCADAGRLAAGAAGCARPVDRDCAAGSAPPVGPAGAASPAPVLLPQRAALRALGVTGGRPPLELAAQDVAEYVRRLQRAGEGAELLDPGGLGAFGWLVQPVGVGVPVELAAAAATDVVLAGATADADTADGEGR